MVEFNEWFFGFTGFFYYHSMLIKISYIYYIITCVLCLQRWIVYLSVVEVLGGIKLRLKV